MGGQGGDLLQRRLCCTVFRFEPFFVIPQFSSFHCKWSCENWECEVEAGEPGFNCLIIWFAKLSITLRLGLVTMADPTQTNWGIASIFPKTSPEETSSVS